MLLTANSRPRAARRLQRFVPEYSRFVPPNWLSSPILCSIHPSMAPTHDPARLSRITRTWAIAFTAWSLFGFAQIILASLVLGRWNEVYIGRSAFQFMPRVWIWALATPLIAAVDFYARRHSHSVARRIAWHLPVFALLCVVQRIFAARALTLRRTPSRGPAPAKFRTTSGSPSCSRTSALTKCSREILVEQPPSTRA